MRIGLFLRLLSILLVAGAFLVWGLPKVLEIGPALCERWKLTTGLCSPQMQERLQALDGWTDRWLRPYSRPERLQKSFEGGRSALQSLEGQARSGVGDEQVDAALRGVDVAVDEADRFLSADARKKVTDIPENAQKLLTEARNALDRLRSVLSSTQRRAEDVTNAVDDTRKALDALSSALPKQQE